MLARQDFGRRHERRLAAGLDHGRGGEQRDDGLARADVAVQKPQHAVRLRQVGDDVLDRALLRRRERIGQGSDDPRAQTAFGGAAAAGALAQMRAQERERELAGEQFVIGKPRPCRAVRHEVVGRRRAVDAAQRVGEARKARCAGATRASCHSGSCGQAFEREVDRLAHLVRMQALGERIDRIDQRQVGETRFVHHAVGVHHLQVAVVERRRCPIRSAARPTGKSFCR